MTSTTPPPGALATDEAPGIFVAATVAGTAVDVHVKIDGDPGSDVVAVFVHGLPGSTKDFAAAARVLAARGGCAVRIDLPGFGRSPPPPAALPLYAPEARADLIAAVMKARGHRRYAVVGHSFGGTAALALAGREATAAAVTAIGLVASVGITRHRGLSIPHELTGALAGLHGVPFVGERVAGPLVGLFRQAMANFGIRGERPYTDLELVEQAATVGALDFKDQRLWAAAVRAPALVLSAGDDRIVEADVSFTLAAALSSSSLVTHHHRARGGHFLQRKVGDVIADWLMVAATR